MNSEFFFYIIMFLVIFVLGAIIETIESERERRIKAERELESITKSFKMTLEEILKEDPKNMNAKITYIVYFGTPVDHTGDEFINGEE